MELQGYCEHDYMSSLALLNKNRKKLTFDLPRWKRREIVWSAASITRRHMLGCTGNGKVAKFQSFSSDLFYQLKQAVLI